VSEVFGAIVVPLMFVRQMKLALLVLWMAIGLTSTAIEAQAHGQFGGAKLATANFARGMTLATVKDPDIFSMNAFLKITTVAEDCCRKDADGEAVCPSGSSCNSGSFCSNCFFVLMQNNCGLSHKNSSKIGLGFVSSLGGRRPAVDERPPRS
jgi:hypothetical protein